METKLASVQQAVSNVWVRERFTGGRPQMARSTICHRPPALAHYAKPGGQFENFRMKIFPPSTAPSQRATTWPPGEVIVMLTRS